MQRRKHFFRVTPEDGYLIAIFLVMAVVITVKSYFTSSGYLSPDATNYLELAQRLLDEGSFMVTPYGVSVSDRELFSVWPAGYPVLIFFVAKLSGLSVFWAAKALNILLVGFTLAMFRSMFAARAYIYGLLFLFSSYIELYTKTWSETLFITALVGFSMAMHSLLSSSTVSRSVYWFLGASSMVLFLSRYVGAFSFGVIGLLGLYYGIYRRQASRGVALVVIALLNIGVMAAYLYNNYQATGFLTGMPRLHAPESNPALLHMWFSALKAEFTIPDYRYSGPLWILLQALLAFVLFCWCRAGSPKRDSRGGDRLLPAVFAGVGVLYILIVSASRWNTQFDPFGYRLLAPGFFLLFIALLNVFDTRVPARTFSPLTVFLLVFCGLSLAQNLLSTHWGGQGYRNFPEKERAIVAKYADIESGSIIVFAEKELRYLRTDLHLRNPLSLPYWEESERWQTFIRRMESSGSPVHLNTSSRRGRVDIYHMSVERKLKKYQRGDLIQLR